MTQRRILSTPTPPLLAHPAAPPDDLPPYDGDLVRAQFRPGEIETPRLLVAQNTSRRLNEDNPFYDADLKPGNIYNSSSGQIYEQPVKLLVLCQWRSRIHFKNVGGEIDCSSDNAFSGGARATYCADCELSQWKQGFDKRAMPPACNEFINFACFVYPTLEPICLPLKSSNLKRVRRYNGEVVSRGQGVLFRRLTELSSIRETGENGAYYVLAMTLGDATPVDLLPFCNRAAQELTRLHPPAPTQRKELAATLTEAELLPLPEGDSSDGPTADGSPQPEITNSEAHH